MASSPENLPPDVVETLVHNHREFLAFLERRVGDRAVAEDILQEAFARGLERLPSLREQESAVAWFYRVLRNAVVDHFRRRGASSSALERLASELETAEKPTVEIHDAVCQCVGRLASTLKPEYADALRRVEVEGVPVQQFATEAGITANNAGVRLHRARNALRERVMASCGTCAEHGCVDCTCKAHGAV
ncbi:MAG: sigma-70 family RNA polymerase sigma factor [Myxococcota bacterium]